MPHGSPGQNGLKVLVLSNRQSAARQVRAQLDAGGVAEVVTVPDLDEACRSLASRDFDLAIADDRVIATDRAGVLRRLREAAPGLSVIVLTGPKDARAVRESLKSGAVDCITRDELGNSAFARGVANVLEGVLRRRDTDWFQKDLISMFSHDLMTPLANILGYASLLVEGKDSRLEDRAGSHIARILANAKFMHEPLESILLTLRLDAGKMVARLQPLDARELIREAIGRNEFLARDAVIALEAQMPEEPVLVHADRHKVAQMLDNLISNAIKFSPDGKRVLVTTRQRGDGVELEVLDYGPGIPHEEQSSLFRKFSQTSVSPLGRGRSTGLGLYIVDQLARLQGGAVAVRSAPGQGSTFTITLPSWAAPEAGTLQCDER